MTRRNLIYFVGILAVLRHCVVRSERNELGSLSTRRCLAIYTFSLNSLNSTTLRTSPITSPATLLTFPLITPSFKLVPYYHYEVRLAGFEGPQ